MERYERDGYSTVPQLVDLDELRELRVLLDARFGNEIETGNTVEAVIDNLPLAALCLRAAAVAERLLGEDVRSTFVKLHRLGDELLANGRGWHQALAYHHLPFTPRPVDVRLDDLEVLVMLDDCRATEACLWIAPGYHVAPLMEHRRNPNGSLELVDPGRQIVLDDTVPVPLGAGDAVAYTLGTPHSCWGSIDGRPVRAVRFGFRTVH